MEPPKLSHLPKNSHKKARFDFGADLLLGMDLNNDVDIHVGRPGTMCYGTLYPVSWGLRRDGGREGWGRGRREEEGKRKKGGRGPYIPSTTRTFLEWAVAYFPNLSIL
ncbi:hypothetical protein N7471_007006 [Penicillium samsonianum]|uniref:uncharacterized protein n=1 Tax=Penicillium samsonianum TaxID=1882272 RepID=UPI002548E140|nr:uncharacterized protein N7471_007006 [Penicillium samsonianum]KAJ6131791.1 hypothetical protein N7471_007006 [Penicillium samsonianum]